MKAKTLLFCAFAAGGLVACADKPQPQAPTTSGTTTTTSYTPPQQPAAPRAATPPPAMTDNETSSLGADGANNPTGMPNKGVSPIADDSASAMNDPQVTAKPVQPAATDTTKSAKTSDTTTKSKSAMDQGNSTTEVKTTAHIRKTMMVSKTLSFGAKNVKVITHGTKVTLVGSVKSDAEKNEIEGIARDTDGVREVDNQLLVKQ